MTPDLWTKVDDYFIDLFQPRDAALDAALRASEAAGLPAINVAPNQGKLLQPLGPSAGRAGDSGNRHARRLQHDLAGAGAAGGRPAGHARGGRRTRRGRAGQLLARGVGGLIDLRVGRAIDTLPQLAAEGRGPFDLIFIDADKAGIPEYFDWALKLSRRGTPIVVDNVVREERWPTPPATPRCWVSAVSITAREGTARERDGDPDRRQQGLRRVRAGAGGRRSLIVQRCSFSPVAARVGRRVRPHLEVLNSASQPALPM